MKRVIVTTKVTLILLTAVGGSVVTLALWLFMDAQHSEVIPGPKATMTLSMDKGAIMGLAFSPNGKILAGAGDSLRIWNLANDGEVIDLEGGVQTHAVAFSTNGKVLASGAFDGKVRLWNPNNWALQRILEQGKPICCVAISADGNALASGDVAVDATVRVWEVGGVKVKFALAHKEMQHIIGVAFSPDGSKLISVISSGVNIWDISSGEKSGVISEDTAQAFAFCPDRNLLALGIGSGGATLWDMGSLQKRAILGHHQGKLHGLAFSHNGELVASVGGGKLVHDPGELKLWDVGTGELKACHRIHSALVQCVAFSPDGDLIATGSLDGTVKLWKLSALLKGEE